jgi:predicted alternative tryptophan synthase beta-subunit|tara:strand:- start:2761 stop:3087 length:327 start_codon:yes stop_codon:yes gene_type:complete
MSASIKEMIEFEDVLPSTKDKTMVNRELVEDMVNHPPHYNQSGIECLDAIKAATDEGFQYYLQGNIIKYIWRYRYKNGIEDVDKAIFYSKRLREVLENECKSNDDTKS